MPIIKEPEATEDKLVLGDYVTVHMSGTKTVPYNHAEPSDMQEHRKEFVGRIQKQRGEYFRRLQKREGKLIDVRHSGVA